MCLYMIMNVLKPTDENTLSPVQHAFLRLLLLVLLLTIGSGFLVAAQSEEYLAVQRYALPKDAVAFSSLTKVGESYTYQGEAFSGIAFERFPNGKLQRAVSYLNGKQDGLMQLWYPDGAPQMCASYKNGVLHGRFLGWYQTGGVIYDMVINRGGYAGDSVMEDDDSRQMDDTEIYEGEGRDNDQNPE